MERTFFQTLALAFPGTPENRSSSSIRPEHACRLSSVLITGLQKHDFGNARFVCSLSEDALIAQGAQLAEEFADTSAIPAERLQELLAQDFHMPDGDEGRRSPIGFAAAWRRPEATVSVSTLSLVPAAHQDIEDDGQDNDPAILQKDSTEHHEKLHRTQVHTASPFRPPQKSRLSSTVLHGTDCHVSPLFPGTAASPNGPRRQTASTGSWQTET